MKQRSGPRKTASNLSDSIHQQFNMYALAAAVAVVSVLVLTQPLEARIVYTPTNIQVYDPYNLDLNHDGVTDFILQDVYHWQKVCDRGPLFTYRLLVSPRPGSQSNGVVVSERGGSETAALFRDGQIGAGRNFSFYTNNYMAIVFAGYVGTQNRCQYKRGTYGHWVNASDRYLGLEFKVKGKTHYGWARLSVQVGYVYIIATLTGYAYETIPGKSIKAGQTKSMADDPTNEDFGTLLTSPIPNTPLPATLGALLTGAPGLSIWRREEVSWCWAMA